MVILLLMLMLNVLRPVLSWGVSGGYEQTGFPFVVHERGGLSYSESTYWLSVVLNLLVALTIANLGAHFFCDGLYAAFRKFQTWGTEDAT